MVWFPDSVAEWFVVHSGVWSYLTLTRESMLGLIWGYLITCQAQILPSLWYINDGINSMIVWLEMCVPGRLVSILLEVSLRVSPEGIDWGHKGDSALCVGGVSQWAGRACLIKGLERITMPSQALPSGSLLGCKPPDSAFPSTLACIILIFFPFFPLFLHKLLGLN